MSDLNLRDLPDVLRATGVPVRTLTGWQTLTTKSPNFHPTDVVWHHDASAPGDSPGVPEYMRRNYNTAGAQLWVDNHGEWVVISCNKANHAGVVLGGMPGNSNSFGVETDHTVGEAWRPDQLASLRLGTIGMLKWMGSRPGDGLHFHKTICFKVGRKSDPDGLDLRGERQALEAMWNGAVHLSMPATPLPAPPVPAPIPAGPSNIAVDGDWGPATTRALQLALGVPADGILGPQTYRALQAKVGTAVDGQWGPNSRRALQRHLGVAADGVVGPLTVRALQIRLNARSL